MMGAKERIGDRSSGWPGSVAGQGSGRPEAITLDMHVEWAMDVGEWLRGLGLGEYENKFRDNRIDAEVLSQLTADNLRDIGVYAVGDRRKLIAAIAALAGTASKQALMRRLSRHKPGAVVL